MTALLTDRPLATLVHSGRRAPLVTGGDAEDINLDHAASAAPLRAVVDAVSEYLTSGQYSAIHRGPRWASVWSTNLYEVARDVARWFFHAPTDSAVIWTENTTGAINIVAQAFESSTRVLVCAFEHHANLLPWGLCDYTLLPVPPDHGALLEAMETELTARRFELVTVTGASNVTGEIPPIAQITELAHRHGARVLLDAAQLAPHHLINMQALGVDWVACSGHKLGAPFRVGCLIGPPLPTDRPPLIRGGGIVDFVLPDMTTMWVQDPEQRHEPGSQNVVGVLATAVAMATLRPELDRVAVSERVLMDVAVPALASVPGLRTYRMWPGTPRIGVLTFNIVGDRRAKVEPIPYALLAAVLAAEHAVGTRGGCHCAHPLWAHLMGLDLPAARRMGEARRSGGTVLGGVRMSMGLDTTVDSVLALVDALLRIVKHGPQWDYQLSADTSTCVPVNDPRGEYVMPYIPPWG
jgi:selenocysteine lyase/cysteine desulfurase